MERIEAPRHLLAALGLLGLLAGLGCIAAEHRAAPYPADLGANRNMANRAYSVIRPVDYSGVHGRAWFQERADGTVRVHLRLRGLQPGRHGVHIHQAGDCSGPGAAGAGSHFDPRGSMTHGGPDDPAGEHHAGDLGNIEAGNDGRADATILTSSLSVRAGALSIDGRSIIVHAQGDNLTDMPANGGSGERVGCGIIRSEVRRPRGSLRRDKPQEPEGDS